MNNFKKINDEYICKKCQKKYKNIYKKNGELNKHALKHINNCKIPDLVISKNIKKPDIKKPDIKKPSPGIKCESRFVCSLQKFIGTKINKKLSKLFEKNDINIKENDILINVIGCGTLRNKDTKTKKSDVMLIFKSGKKIGISYKMDKAWAVSGWAKYETWINILGQKNFSLIYNDIPTQMKGNKNRLFLGISIHLTNNKTLIPMTKYDKNFNMFSAYFDKNTKLLFSSTKSSFNSLEDFLKHKKLQSQKEVMNDDTKKLYIIYRYVYFDKSSGNNSAQIFTYFKFDENKIKQFKGKNFNNTEELLKYGKFVPYSKIFANKFKYFNTRNLIKYYEKKYNITFKKKN